MGQSQTQLANRPDHRSQIKEITALLFHKPLPLTKRGGYASAIYSIRSCQWVHGEDCSSWIECWSLSPLSSGGVWIESGRVIDDSGALGGQAVKPFYNCELPLWLLWRCVCVCVVLCGPPRGRKYTFACASTCKCGARVCVHAHTQVHVCVCAFTHLRLCVCLCVSGWEIKKNIPEVSCSYHYIRFGLSSCINLLS